MKTLLSYSMLAGVLLFTSVPTMIYAAPTNAENQELAQRRAGAGRRPAGTPRQSGRIDRPREDRRDFREGRRDTRRERPRRTPTRLR